MTSIKRISLFEVAELLDGLSGPLLRNINFHDIFGTEGCLLDCEERRKTQQRLYRPRERGTSTGREKISSTETSLKDESLMYFTRKDFDSSASVGCTSCRILGAVIDVVFIQNDEQLRDGEDEGSDARYSVSASFLMHEECTNASMTRTRRIQLFSLKGTEVPSVTCSWN